MRRLTLLAAILVACAQLLAAPPPATMDNAEAARSASDYETARRLYTILARDESLNAKDHEKAQIALANIEWRIDADPSGARTRLATLGTGKAWIETSRMECDGGRWAAGEAAARKALAVSSAPDEIRDARTNLARALIQGHVDARLDGTPVPPTDLREGFTLARALVSEERNRLSTSRLLLDAALLLGDNEAALDAWHSYYADVAARFRAPDSKLNAALLTDSRLFDEAVLAGAGADVVAYDAYIRRVKKMTDAYYRDVANRRGDRRAYAKAMERETRGISDLLHLPWNSKTLDGIPDTPLGDRFGSVIAMGTTGSVFNLHFGHRVVDEKRDVEQYGRKSAVRFILLDTMVSNGFETWSWDGSGQHGGWGAASRIIQVRPAYAEGPLQAWRGLHDAKERAEMDEKIARESADDWKRAATDPYAFLPGLRLRMLRESWSLQLDALKARGVSGAALHDAFVAELGRREQESSIFAHEGRHAIDAQYAPVRDAQAEFQAKLSEIAFAPDPKLALTGGILGNSIGTNTPHGIANSRIMKGLVAWMSGHRQEIAGLDAARPLLPQLDKMSDDQLRAAARSMDPYAK